MTSLNQPLSEVDPEIAEVLRDELGRQQRTLEMIASENFVPQAEVERLAKETRPKLIIAGWSAYPRFLDFERFRAIADEVGAYLFVDMAHFAGLVAAGLHPNPVPYADVVASTVHKTLGGPRSGFILCKEEDAKKINSAGFPGQQGGPPMHAIAAQAVAFQIPATAALL